MIKIGKNRIINDSGFKEMLELVREDTKITLYMLRQPVEGAYNTLEDNRIFIDSVDITEERKAYLERYFGNLDSRIDSYFEQLTNSHNGGWMNFPDDEQYFNEMKGYGYDPESFRYKLEEMFIHRCGHAYELLNQCLVREVVYDKETMNVIIKSDEETITLHLHNKYVIEILDYQLEVDGSNLFDLPKEFTESKLVNGLIQEKINSVAKIGAMVSAIGREFGYETNIVLDKSNFSEAAVKTMCSQGAYETEVEGEFLSDAVYDNDLTTDKLLKLYTRLYV